jgi:hypothetical protein
MLLTNAIKQALDLPLTDEERAAEEARASSSMNKR